MSKGNAFETALLSLIFTNTAIAGIAAALGTAGSLFLALHTANPGEAGNQTTSEAAYTGYQRVAVARSTGAFVVAGNAVNPAAAITWPAPTAVPVPGSATYFSIGTASNGAGMILYSGAITSPIPFVVGVQPTLTDDTVVTED